MCSVSVNRTAGMRLHTEDENDEEESAGRGAGGVRRGRTRATKKTPCMTQRCALSERDGLCF